MTHYLIPAIECILIAFSAGLFTGLFGSGSGLVMTPGFFFILRHIEVDQHMSMQMAITSTAAVSAILGCFSARVHYRSGATNPKILKLVIPGLLLGTVTAVILLGIIPSGWLKVIFGGVVILVAIWLCAYKAETDLKTWRLHGVQNILLTTIIGLLWFLLGVAVFVAPYLHKCGQTMKQAIANTSFINTVLCAIATTLLITRGYFYLGFSLTHLGYLNFFLFFVSIIPGALGSRFGASISVKLPPQKLKIIFACLAGLSGLIMIF